MQTNIKLSRLVMNTGQIAGLPKNPRKWTQTDIDRLARSIQETPELLDVRPLIVVEHGNKFVVLGGNLRLAALKKLGWDEVPCFLLPSSAPVDKLKEIVIKDNGSFGQWDYDQLANEWDDLDLGDWGVPAWNPGGGEPIDIKALFDPSKKAGKEKEMTLTVTIPKDLEEKVEDIKASLVLTLEDFPGCKVE